MVHFLKGAGAHYWPLSREPLFVVLKERAYQTAANELERDIAHFEAFVSDALLRLPVRYSLEEVPRNSQRAAAKIVPRRLPLPH